jgi:hypothetical protein
VLVAAALRSLRLVNNNGEPVLHQEGSMRLKTHLAAVIGASCLAASPGFASVITFDSVPSSGNPILTTLTTDGFTFTSGHFHTLDTRLGFVDEGTIYIAEEAGSLGLPITMARSSGGVFDLTGFDGAEVFVTPNTSFPDADILRAVGSIFGGGTITATFTLDGIRDGLGGVRDFQTFVMPAGWTNLTSVTFDGLLNIEGPGGISLDNIVVDETGAPIPEPGTLLLVGSGLIGLAARRRRPS